MKEIFADASSFIKKPATLSTLVSEIGRLDWYSARKEGLGDLYEGLLEKNANEKNPARGNTSPRASSSTAWSPSCSRSGRHHPGPRRRTGGFLIAANHHLSEHYDFDSLSEARQKKYATGTFYGMEHVQDTRRLAMMNLMLHGIRYGDTLPKATLILTNPPFGTKKGGGLPPAPTSPIPPATNNSAFCSTSTAVSSPAVVLPDNVLFESGIGKDIRRDLMDKCNLRTTLRLSIGIFYAQGVKTNVLFFTRGQSERKSGSMISAPTCRSLANAPR